MVLQKEPSVISSFEPALTMRAAKLALTLEEQNIKAQQSTNLNPKIVKRKLNNMEKTVLGITQFMEKGESNIIKCFYILLLCHIYL